MRNDHEQRGKIIGELLVPNITNKLISLPHLFHPVSVAVVNFAIRKF